MLRIAGQTAGPIGLTFFVDTQGLPGGVLGYKNSNFFSNLFKNIFFRFPRATPCPSASIK